MPDFRWLPDDELRGVIEYVILLSQRGQLERQLKEEAEYELGPGDKFNPAVVDQFAATIQDSWEDSAAPVVFPISPMPPYTAENIEKGRILFQGAACVKCHGVDAEGGRRPDVDPDNLPKDDWGQVAFAADLTGRMLRGGRRPIDIYRRIHSGIDGSTMPGFANQFQDDPDQIWYLVHFVTSVIEGNDFPIPEEGATEVPNTSSEN